MGFPSSTALIRSFVAPRSQLLSFFSAPWTGVASGCHPNKPLSQLTSRSKTPVPCSVLRSFLLVDAHRSGWRSRHISWPPSCRSAGSALSSPIVALSRGAHRGRLCTGSCSATNFGFLLCIKLSITPAPGAVELQSQILGWPTPLVPFPERWPDSEPSRLTIIVWIRHCFFTSLSSVFNSITTL